MKPSTALVSLLLVPWLSPVFGADNWKPASSNVPGAEYPRVSPDGRIAFRFEAPHARKVKVVGRPLGTYEMRRDANGTWSVDTPPVTPGFHHYSLLVDGVMMNDPGSETFFSSFRQTSGVEVPEIGVDFYNATDVPHGEVRMLWYHSKITASVRRAFVYTPPSYDASSGTRYPVLYLQHGGSGDERGWTLEGRMNFIMDNLLAEKRARPMLVVTDCGYAAKPGERPAPWLPIEMNAPRTALHTFEEVILTELIPRVDSTYRTIPHPQHRAFAGQSMGGIQALHIIHHDQFSYYGSFSGPVGHEGALNTAYTGIFNDPESFNKRVRLLWLGVGTNEKRYYDGIRRFHERLDEAGIKHVFSESIGTDHEWLTWRRALRDFACLLFKS